MVGFSSIFKKWAKHVTPEAATFNFDIGVSGEGYLTVTTDLFVASDSVNLLDLTQRVNDINSKFSADLLVLGVVYSFITSGISEILGQVLGGEFSSDSNAYKEFIIERLKYHQYECFDLANGVIAGVTTATYSHNPIVSRASSANPELYWVADRFTKEGQSSRTMRVIRLCEKWNAGFLTYEDYGFSYCEGLSRHDVVSTSQADSQFDRNIKTILVADPELCGLYLVRTAKAALYRAHATYTDVSKCDNFLYEYCNSIMSSLRKEMP